MEVPMSIPSSEIKLEAKVEKAKLYWIVTFTYSLPVWRFSYGVDNGTYLCGIFDTQDEANQFKKELEHYWGTDPRAFCEDLFSEGVWDEHGWLMEDKNALPNVEIGVIAVRNRQFTFIGGGFYEGLL